MPDQVARGGERLHLALRVENGPSQAMRRLTAQILVNEDRVYVVRR